MILSIDTSDKELIKLILENKKGETVKTKKISAHRKQAEKLLKSIDSLLKLSNIDLDKIVKIKVAHQGDSFTALRIGVLTANALAYALGIEVEAINYDKKSIKKLKNFNIITPKYNRDLDIKVKKY